VEQGAGQAFITFAEPALIDGVWAPSHVRRLLLPNESVKLSEDCHMRLIREERPEDGPTRAFVQAMLASFDGAEAPRGASLVCLTGLDAGRAFPLLESGGLIGRALEMVIRIRDRAVSKEHARIFFSEGAWWLEDLGTPNGTFVNNQRIRSPKTLGEWSIIEMGQTLLRFDAASGSERSPESEDELEVEVETGATSHVSQLLAICLGGLMTLAGIAVTYGLAFGRGG
jgi:hypothetical protein